jgi:glycosyltransferase involved in cell wall biosynthesis
VGREDQRPVTHFAVVVTGWNCVDVAGACCDSIESQVGDFTREAIYYDDGSDDGTSELLAGMGVRTYRATSNDGAARARFEAIRTVTRRDAVVVLVDMDDALEPGALARVALEYQDPDVWMTFGNWCTQHGRVGLTGYYPRAVIARRSYRKYSVNHAAPLRTFRRPLFDRVQPSHLKDDSGRWLQVTTDRGQSHP